MNELSGLEAFQSNFHGELLQPEDDGYDAARKLYNAMIDKRPRLIARCADVADVISAVNFGRDQGLEVAIRGGGHNGAGLALVDDGLVVDLSGMKGVRVDPENETVRVVPGCSWADVDHATHAFGQATVSGIISSTGVTGLALGGGHGYLSRKYGLTVDNLLESGFRKGAQRPGHRDRQAIRRRSSHRIVHHALVSDQRGRPANRPAGYGLQLSRCHLVTGHRGSR